MIVKRIRVWNFERIGGIDDDDYYFKFRCIGYNDLFLLLQFLVLT